MKKLKAWLCRIGLHRWDRLEPDPESYDFGDIEMKCRWCGVLTFIPKPASE